MIDYIFKRNTIVNPNLEVANNENQTIKIAQWNIFAQGFVVADKYQYCSPSDLTLENRKLLFKKELNYIKADIYCFQEADIHEILYEILNESCDKYCDIFASKVYSSCLLYPNNCGSDGCSIIYNKEKFECLYHCTLEFEQTKSQVCLFAVFCFNSNSKLKFITACTHLKADKRFKDVRLNQCSSLLSALQALMLEWEVTSAFICGDFNATPDEETIKIIHDSPLNFVDVYDELKSESKLKQHYTTWSFRKTNATSKHSISDACSPTFNSEREDIIDYIWYTSSASNILQINSNNRTSIKPISILDVPDKEEIGVHGIPSPNIYPSDHIYLVATFIIEN